MFYYQDLRHEWPPVIPSLPQLVETAEVPNVGKFRAYSNGSIHVVFADRTILIMNRPSVNEQNKREIRLSAPELCEEEEFYQLTLPNGVCVPGVSACNPQGFQR